MSEQIWVNRFCHELDRILQGTGTKQQTEPVPDKYRKMVELANILATADFCREHGTMSERRQRLLDMFAARKRSVNGDFVNDYTELDDEELAKVVGGGKTSSAEASCCLCGCRRSKRTITGNTCPDCGCPREGHGV